MKKFLSILALMTVLLPGVGHAEMSTTPDSRCEATGETTTGENELSMICANHQWHVQRPDAPYAATDQDKTMYALIARWAAHSGLESRWEAGEPIAIQHPAALNDIARLASAQGFSDAFKRLHSVNEAVPSMPVLVACVYRNDHIVAIRENSCLARN